MTQNVPKKVVQFPEVKSTLPKQVVVSPAASGKRLPKVPLFSDGGEPKKPAYSLRSGQKPTGESITVIDDPIPSIMVIDDPISVIDDSMTGKRRAATGRAYWTLKS